MIYRIARDPHHAYRSHRISRDALHALQNGCSAASRGDHAPSDWALSLGRLNASENCDLERLD
jgi:hypothetical protein